MGWALLAVAGATLVKKILLSRAVENSLSWPRAEGEITQSRITMQNSSTGFNHANKTFKAEVTYKYTVGKRSYRNNRICVGGQLQLSLRGKAEGYCEQYPVGQNVAVYYNPNDPSDSCLERREETSNFYLLAGAVFAIVGIVFITG